ncbi:carbon-nitrogen hydrolase family protein [Vibrio sp. Of7-15]|uniref:carbon-nitrogen hydrolase family protein n=1 Tax=Vibrio sp. Of7-15 TaxID=2724879 RepID=UPI001EF2A58F|nr:carbon-nitrogen hydrolase family protein [Vibrio sp. Of7-15]MCG7498543.1 carbon-nitrogen hydrolase family protein [Vibrio sp. Of7-15]
MAKIGVVQMTSGEDPEKNLEHLARKLKGLQLQGAELVVTPENTVVFGSRDDYLKHAETLGKGPIQDQLSEMARHYRIWLVVGSMPILTVSGEVTATSLVYDDQGQLIEFYDKLHMFDVDVEDGHHSYRESDTFKAGDQIKVVETPFGKLGLSICYDVRFPQLYSELRQQGADIIVVPAAFTKVTGRAHWEVLLRARAIETQCWLLASAQWGEHNAERETWGHSMMIDPWGNIVAEQKEGTGVLLTDIDISVSDGIRQKMPVAKHARLTCHLHQK